MNVDRYETKIVTCKACGKKYKQRLEDQVPGFRIPDSDDCPYCGASNGRSMRVEHYNEKLEEGVLI